MTTIQKTDVATSEFELPANEAETGFDGANAFLSSFEDGEDDEDASRKKPSDEGEQDERDDTDEDEGSENSDESPEDDETDEDDGETEEKEDEKSFVESDDVFVKVKEGDTEHTVSIKDLKRLYGQEAALTRKSQEVATARQTATEAAERNFAVLNVMLDKAKKKADEYRNIDWLAISKDPDISAEQASALRTMAQEALNEEAFFTQHLDQFMGEVKQQQTKARAEEVKATIKALTTAPTDDKPNPLHIDGWNDKVYDEVREFGIKLGAPAEVINNITDAVSIKVLHMAMLFAKGASKVKTEKVNKSPKRIVKTSASPVATRQPTKATDRKAAIREMRKTGSDEAAVNAFMIGLDD
jgi:hypothetical protein